MLDAESAACAREQDPCEGLERREMHALLQRCLARLSERDRHLLELKFRHGSRAPEIAARLGTSPANVRQRLKRLLDLLRARMES